MRGEMQSVKLSSHQITAFTEVFRQRSVTDAAAALGITQSAVTQHLSNLEKRIGAPLFTRYRSGLEPTKPAIELFALTDQMRVLEQLVSEKIGAYEMLSTGHLTVVANAPRPAMPLIAKFSKLFPGVKINFAVISWAASMQRLEGSQVDIAIVTDPADLPGLYREEILTQKMVAILRRDHPLAKQESVSLNELTANGLILPGEGTLTAREVRAVCNTHGVALTDLIEMTTYPVMKEAVLHGLGVAIALEDSMYPEDELTYRPVREMDKLYKTYLVTTSGRKALHFVRSFFDVATERELG
ncbi:extracellular solute-binding protein [Burkholderia contaminans]|uniref:Extracellular solute-binding protein n=2 Tax=Burkholderia contaminans TaxID=488447 RepID=A0A3N8PUM1_9BURK|nr:extracellular solute-binding protein [Burkholderia contaminans]